MPFDVGDMYTEEFRKADPDVSAKSESSKKIRNAFNVVCSKSHTNLMCSGLIPIDIVEVPCEKNASNSTRTNPTSVSLEPISSN